jgi:HK97 gp10 family phage protein
MPVKVSGVYVDTEILDRITEDIRPNAAEVVNTYGLLIASDAAKSAPVDTSALRNSILSESAMSEEMTYTVQDGVEYGVFQEFGTSKMAAQPFMIPAVEKWSSKFLKAFEGLFK